MRSRGFDPIDHVHDTTIDHGNEKPAGEIRYTQAPVYTEQEQDMVNLLKGKTLAEQLAKVYEEENGKMEKHRRDSIKIMRLLQDYKANKMLTEEILAEIVRNLELGLPPEDAAQAAGVTKRQFNYWQETLPGFSDIIGVSQAAGRKAYLDRIADKSHKQWKAAAWVLERTDPEHFSEKKKIEADITQKTIVYKPERLPVEAIEGEFVDDEEEDDLPFMPGLPEESNQ